MAETIKLGLSPKQAEFVNSKKARTLFCGGLGGGKTFAGAVWVIKMILTYPKTNGFITANSYRQLRSATLATLFGLLDDLGIKYRYRINEGVLLVNDVTIYTVSMENYDHVRGIEVGWAWSDECAYYHQMGFNVLMGRIRDKKGPSYWRGTTTPNGFNWLYDVFVANPLPDSEVIYASTMENAANLSSGYVELLETQYDTRLAAQELHGQFVNLNAGLAYHAFDRNKNCANRLHSNGPIYLGLDFNVNPLCGVFLFEEDGKLFVFDEMHLEHSHTFQAAKEVLKRYPTDRIQVVADETGAKRKTNSAKTDHQILAQSGLDVKPFRNPAVKDRINNVNRHLEQGNLFIHPRCTRLINELEQMAVDNKDASMSHLSDALGYAVWYLKPMRPARRTPKVDYR
jgi:PBSX family phage terminase large subunit